MDGTLPEPYTPQPISGLELVFPAHVAHLMPPAAAIPEEFWQQNKLVWVRLVEQMFFGVASGLKLVPKVDDPETALTHVRAIMGSFEPKHEYKMAASAYLLSLWFADPIWTVKPLSDP
jgi:hypothetical protein